MHLVKSNKIKLLFCSLILISASAKDFSEEILSDTRKKTFELNDKQLKEETSKLKKDWINPITYEFIKNLGDNYKNEKSIISINQPIFRSGGIYEAIKYAKSTNKYGDLEIREQKKMLIKDAINYLFLIEKANLNIQKSKLQVKNAKIDVKRKKEQVLNGFLDSSFLDNALLALNQSKHNLIDLTYQRKEFINSFHNISSKKYTNFSLPHFKLFNKKEFIQNNINLEKAKADIEKKKNFSYITMAKYLPSVNIFYNYSKNHYTDGNPGLSKEDEQRFGISIRMPFDSRTFNDVESQKIEYLKSKLNFKNKKEDEETFFKNRLNKIKMIEDRIKITNEDIEVYNSILKTIKEEKEAQLKTQSDVDTLSNSQRIKLLDLKTFEIDKQLELLNLYVKITK